MNENFQKVKDYLLDLEYTIKVENEEETLLVIENEDAGIVNMILDCDEPLLVIEQHLFDLKSANKDVFKQLLQKNREIIQIKMLTKLIIAK